MTGHLIQIPPMTTDTVAASKLQAATDSVKAHVDSITQVLVNPDSLAHITPKKVVSEITSFDWSGVIATLSSTAVSLTLRILAAVLIFTVGKFIINKIHKLLNALMIKKEFDRSLSTFLLSLIKITLLFLLVITVIGVLGIETSSFIAIFASAGVAVGLALSGTLQNFAGGVLILLNKPYKVGDYIEFEGFKGFVKEIQIFHTVITTYNNERIIIPNGGLSTGTINNYTSESYRRLEWRVSLSYGDSVQKAREVILGILEAEDRIVKAGADIPEDTPHEIGTTEQAEETKKMKWWRRIFHWHRKKAEQWKTAQIEDIKSKLPKKDYTPSVALEEMADSAIVLVVRAWCATADYWPVLYKINEDMYNELPKNGLSFPFPQLDVHFDKTDLKED